MHDLINSVNQLLRISALLLHSIDGASNRQVMWIIDQALMNHRWSQRTKRVHRLANQELAAVALLLPISGGNILGDGVTEHIIHGVRLGYAFRFLADNDGQLNFPVDFLK